MLDAEVKKQLQRIPSTTGKRHRAESMRGSDDSSKQMMELVRRAFLHVSENIVEKAELPPHAELQRESGRRRYGGRLRRRSDGT